MAFQKVRRLLNTCRAYSSLWPVSLRRRKCRQLLVTDPLHVFSAVFLRFLCKFVRIVSEIQVHVFVEPHS